MIILRNKSHGEIIRVCMGMFANALVNKKKYSQFSIKIHHFPSTVHRLLSDHLLCWKEPILASYPFLGLLHKGASLQNWQSKRNLNFNPSTIKLNYIYSFKSKNQTQLILVKYLNFGLSGYSGIPRSSFTSVSGFSTVPTYIKREIKIINQWINKWFDIN